ncbi:hypothetical protein HDU97_004190 [Phlyctochytrium planicorne]|nr:hypothetical protein HDU97_004190 [Phlyctochytrium planicorne]
MDGPSMDEDSTSPNGIGVDGQNKPLPIACHRCREKKRKCDGLRPVCTNCLKAQQKKKDAMCEYAETIRRRGPNKTKPLMVSNVQDGVVPKASKKRKMSAQNEAEEAINPFDSILNFIPESFSMSPPSMIPGTLGLNGSSLVPSSVGGIQHMDGQSTAEWDVINSPNSSLSSGRGSSSSPEGTTAAQFLEFLYSSGQVVPSQQQLTQCLPIPNQLQQRFSPSPSHLEFSAFSPQLHPDQLQHLLGLPTGIPSTLLSPTQGVNLGQVSLDETVLRMLDKPAAFLNMLNATASPTCEVRTAFTPNQYPVLEDHLVAVYFTYINVTMPIFRADIFLRKYTPVNLHPPLIMNAIFAMASLFSNHPDIFSKYKSRQDASLHYMRQAQKFLNQTRDRLTVIQVMAIIGMWEFGGLYGVDSYNWIGRAAREAQKFNLHSPEAKPHYDLSVFFSPYMTQWSPDEFDARLRTWNCVFLMDFYASVVSGLSLGIAESECLPLLVAQENLFKEAKEGRAAKGSTSPPESTDSQSWAAMFTPLPNFTVFDQPELPRGAYGPYSRLALTNFLPLEKQIIPLHFFTSMHEDWYLVQLSFVMRGIARLRGKREVNVSTSSITTQLISAAIPCEYDVQNLHRALLVWYYSLPPEWRPFETFDCFNILRGGITPPPPNGTHSAWAMNPHICHTLLAFTGIMAVLHDPKAGRGAPLFPTRPDSPVQVSSVEILVMAFRAHAYILRCIFSASGWASPPDLDLFLTAESVPPPPAQISTNPALGFFSYALAVKVVEMYRLDFGVQNFNADVVTETITQCCQTIREVVMPTLACISKIWKVNDMFLSHIKQRMSNVPGVFRYRNLE